MDEFILNEREWVENVIHSHTLGRNASTTIGRVAKYYFCEGYPKKEISKLVGDFMLRCDPSVNLIRWQDTIEYRVNMADRYPLVDITGIHITRKEMDLVEKLDGKQLQRLMFTLLCVAKYNNAVNPKNSNWVNTQMKDIFTLSNLRPCAKRRLLMINDLLRLGYISMSSIVDNVSVHIQIVDNSEDDSDIIITDFRNLGNQYLMYCGEDYIVCRSCGLVVKRTGRRQIYCNTCYAEINSINALARSHTLTA